MMNNFNGILQFGFFVFFLIAFSAGCGRYEKRESTYEENIEVEEAIQKIVDFEASVKDVENDVGEINLEEEEAR